MCNATIIAGLGTGFPKRKFCGIDLTFHSGVLPHHDGGVPIQYGTHAEAPGTPGKRKGCTGGATDDDNRWEDDKLTKLLASSEATGLTKDQLAASCKEVGLANPTAAKVNTRDTWHQHQRCQSQISAYNNDLRHTTNKMRRLVKELKETQAKLEQLEGNSEDARIESDRHLASHFEQVGQAKVVKARAESAAADAAAAYSLAQGLLIDTGLIEVQFATNHRRPFSPSMPKQYWS